MSQSNHIMPLKDDFNDEPDDSNEQSLMEQLKDLHEQYKEATETTYGEDLTDEELQRLEDNIYDLEVEGWEVTEGHPRHVIMEYNTYGSSSLHGVLFMLSAGVLNTFYGWFSHSRNKDRKVVRP